MRNRILICTVLVLGVFASVCNAQETTYKISIIDKSTMESVPYARVSFGHFDGVYSDSNGQFTVTTGLPDSIAISHLSFKDTIVLPSKIVDNIIFLTPVSYSLNEVMVTKFTGSLSKKGTTEGEHHSGYGPFPFTINALYIPYDESWDEAPQVNEIFLDLSITRNSNATIQYYLSMPDPLSGSPNGKALSKQSQLELDRRDNKIKNRYYSKVEQPFIFPKTGFFIVFFVADATYSYTEMLSEWGTKKFKMSKYMPFSFYLTAETNELRSWFLNVYSEEASWRICDHNNIDWNKIVAGMKVENDGHTYNFMGGVIVQLPK